MRVRYTPEAFSDRERIFQYLLTRSLSGAGNVLASIRESVRLLGEHPHAGYKTNHPDIRVKFLTRYPYKVFYRVRDDVVEILHIRHTARRRWRWEREF
jgi:toxin ParE1/3/4